MDGVVLRSRMAPRTAAPSARTGPEIGTLEGIADAFFAAADAEPGLPEARRREALDDGFAELVSDLTRNGVQGSFTSRPARAGFTVTYDEDAIWRAAQTRPELAARLPKTIEDYRAQLIAPVDRQIATRSDRASRAGNVATLGGALAAGASDPLNVATMGIMGVTTARTVLQAAINEAKLNVGMELMQAPSRVVEHGLHGRTTEASEVATDLATAAVAGGLFGAAGKAIELKVAQRANRSLALADEAETAIGAPRMTPDEADAVATVRRAGEIEATNPYEQTGAGTAAHEAKLTHALTSLLHEDAPARPATVGSSLSPERIIGFVQNDLEGGSAVVRYGSVDGGTTKWGIAAKFNPGVDVANLTEAQARRIAYGKYWFGELNSVEPRTAAVAFDAGFIAGPKVGKRILRESGGDADRALALYRDFLNGLADSNPAKAKYRKGWNNRVDKLARFVDAAPSSPMVRRDEFAPDITGDATWRVAQAEVTAEQALTPRFDTGETPGGWDDDIPFDLDDPRMLATPRDADFDPFAYLDDDMPVAGRGGVEAEAAPRAPEDVVAPRRDDAPLAPEAAEPVLAMEGSARPDDALLPSEAARAVASSDVPAAPAVLRPTSAGTVQMRLEPRDVTHEAEGLRSMWQADAMRGDRPAPVYALRPEGGGDIIAFSPSRRVMERTLREPPIEGEWELVRVHPPEDLMPARPIDGFDHEEDIGMTRQMDSLEHDIRMAVDADPELTVQMDEDGEPRRLADVLAELDDEEAAIEAARACMMPGGGEMAA